MRNDYNDNWEEIMRNEGIPRSTDYIKAKLSVELEMYKASKSSISDSLDQINNPFAQDNGSSMEKNNVRVRKMDAPGFVPSYQPINNSPVSDSVNYTGGYVDSSSYQSYTNNSGSANVLILMSVAALVILVVLVSLYIMSTLGL